MEGPVALRELAPTERTVRSMLKPAAGLDDGRPLVRAGGLERTRAEMRDAVARAAGSLSRAGVEPGDRVAMLCGSRIELLDAILACGWLGAVAVPLNAAVRGRALEHLLSNSGARLLITECERMEALPKKRPDALEEVWLLDELPSSIPARYSASEARWDAEPVAAAETGPGETVAILYTSGTTGVSKGVLCSNAQFYWWGLNIARMLEFTERDVLHTTLPVYHSNALGNLYAALLSGAAFVFEERFSASAFWHQLRESGATVTFLLGAMVTILYNREPSAQDREHSIRVSLSPSTPTNLYLPFEERFGFPLVDAYGSTETNCVIGALPGERRPGFMGYALDGFEARVVNSQDRDVEDGAAGELVLRNREPFAFSSGYHDMPDKTVEAWRNLWFHTGDRATREADGWFRFLDRTKDAIRRRGENISSLEVQQAITEHPAVDDAAAFPVPSELGEDEVMVAIVLKPGESMEPEELIAHCEPRLARFAIPRYVDFVGGLPMTENGKISKVLLRERGISETAWDREAATEGVRA